MLFFNWLIRAIKRVFPSLQNVTLDIPNTRVVEYAIIIKIRIREHGMRMTKTLMAVVLAATVGIMGVQQASARDVNQQGDSPRHFQKMDDATKAQIEKFRADTKDLRKQMVMKRAEKSALVRSETPNIEAVKKAAGELFDLRMAMMEKAKAAGLFAFKKQGDGDVKFAEKHAKIEKFFADTKDLRKQLSVERAAKRALMNSRTPDPLAVAKISGELFDLKNTLHEKAIAAGLPGHFHGMGHGRHFSHGDHHDSMG